MKRLYLLLSLVALPLLVSPVWAEIQSSPVGASAECMDGMFSTSSGRGTCSHHGGVKRKLDGSQPESAPSPRRRSGSQVSGAVWDSPNNGSSGGGSGVGNGARDFGGDGTNNGFSETSESFGNGASRGGRLMDGSLPNTGGTPWLLVTLGSVITGGGLFARRRLK